MKRSILMTLTEKDFILLHCYTDSIDMVIIKALYSQEHCTYMFIQDGKYRIL